MRTIWVPSGRTCLLRSVPELPAPTELGVAHHSRQVLMETGLRGLQYRQVDVFADGATGGNGLAVFWDCRNLSTALMQQLTVELRQFESVFVFAARQPGHYMVRVFTMEEELDFAGHPLLGSAAVLHEKRGRTATEQWTLHAKTGPVKVATATADGGFAANMTQPKPVFVEAAAEAKTRTEVASWVGLTTEDLDPDLPLEVVSTGLPYLIIPVRSSLSRARVRVDDLEARLRRMEAKFLYVYDVPSSEGRTWDNRGLVEDIATGSAAGPVAAYLCKHRRWVVGQELTIRQGQFVGRPSVLRATVVGSTDPDSYQGVEVKGRVNMVATGAFD